MILNGTLTDPRVDCTGLDGTLMDSVVDFYELRKYFDGYVG